MDKRLKQLTFLDFTLLSGFLITLLFGNLIKPFLPPCAIYNFSGFYCGSCGITRMLIHLSEFQIIAAFKNNPFLFLLLFYAGVLLIIQHICVLRKQAFPKRLFQTHYLYILLVLFVLFSIMRNIPVYPFTLLIP